MPGTVLGTPSRYIGETDALSHVIRPNAMQVEASMFLRWQHREAVPLSASRVFIIRYYAGRVNMSL